MGKGGRQPIYVFTSDGFHCWLTMKIPSRVCGDYSQISAPQLYTKMANIALTPFFLVSRSLTMQDYIVLFQQQYW